MLQLEAAPRVHRVEDAYTNWYLIEDGKDLTIVDAGTRASWSSFQEALGKVGRDRSAVKALVLTHGHFDHLGFAERARLELGVPVFVHEADEKLTREPLSYAHERSRVPYLLKPRAMPIVAALLRQRAFWPPPIESVRTFTEGTLPVPGSPQVVFTPGHTFGHCCLYLPDRDTLIAGDAIVTLNPYTGDKGPQIVAGAATADSTTALTSLDAVDHLAASIVLTGHGRSLERRSQEGGRAGSPRGAVVAPCSVKRHRQPHNVFRRSSWLYGPVSPATC
jgi:glyoxylase-like metal-dependent hydrolase (beta-lactamase superfamily II)